MCVHIGGEGHAKVDRLDYRRGAWAFYLIEKAVQIWAWSMTSLSVGSITENSSSRNMSQIGWEYSNR